MKVSAINKTQNNQKISIKRMKKTNQNNFTREQEGVLQTNSVAFKALAKVTPNTKMKMFAETLLSGLKENQKVYMRAESKFVPFMNILSELAYKKGSGKVEYKVLEPELENLKEKYNIKEEFEYQKAIREDLQKSNALFLEFSDKNNPYKLSRLTEAETIAETNKMKLEIPKNIYDKFKINPKEIFKEALDLKQGQSIVITAEREHLPFVEKLVDYLYSENKSKLVDVRISEDSNISMLKYAKDDILEEFPTYDKMASEEFLKTDTALLDIDAGFQNSMEGVDTKRINKWWSNRSKAMAEINNKRFNETPWLVYYIPTTKTCVSAYPELKDAPFNGIEQAFLDANKINRIGALGEHRKNLIERTKKLNELAEQGFRSFHYESIDSKTGKPDGKTDFNIKLSPKSKFAGPLLEYEKNQHSTIPNIPTEESFSAPMANSAQGKLAVTKPLLINEKLVTGINFEFKDGKVVKVSAKENEDVLKDFIKTNENADRLGEIAFVAGSPIAKTGRFFNTTLVDENATCHFALGKAYGYCVEGANEIKNYADYKKYMKENQINLSPIHEDFMVGGENVKITAINERTGETKTIIENDKFLL